MEILRRIAYATVMRACGFSSLAIFCLMVGLSFEPRLAFQTGGFFTLMMTAVLLAKAVEARKKPYRRTEMWLYVPEEARPPAASAQQLVAVVMQETYLTFARWTSGVAVVMWSAALILSLAWP